MVFVTTTRIGIDGDATTRSLVLGYDRYEGVVGPAYETGALPPVFAHIETDLAWFYPKIKQTYATGDAALLVTRAKEKVEPDKLLGNRRPMLFGTGTNLGFKVVFAANVPESMNFGYKRKEYSAIPVGKRPAPERESGQRAPTDLERLPEEQTPDEFGSVLARLDLDLNMSTLPETKFHLLQFLATGNAADALAADEDVRKFFQAEVVKELESETATSP